MSAGCILGRREAGNVYLFGNEVVDPKMKAGRTVDQPAIVAQLLPYSLASVVPFFPPAAGSQSGLPVAFI
ncbi:MAG: hypothetical protein EHM18_09230 [Acidobacteria bacterium]|nr:MAG: hypothetical protein EHM18_09230 [Acidobacteriota bacterium]